MIIEFLGVSGVGKTTVAKAYKQKLEKEGKVVIWDTYDLYAKNGWLIRNLKKSFTVLIFGVLNPRWVKRYKIFLDKNISNKRDIPKPLFNATFLKALLVKAKKDDKIHIFDEGALQYLWAVKLRNDNCKWIRKQDVNAAIDFFGLPDKLIVVNASVKTIVTRIKQRGEYVKIMDYGNLNETVTAMNHLKDEIVSFVRLRTEIEAINND